MEENDSYFWSEEESDEQISGDLKQERKSGCRRVLAAIFGILILLLLFWPVDKSALKTKPRKSPDRVGQHKQVGSVRYNVIEAGQIAGGEGAKTVTVKVRFKVKNTGTRAAELSYNMVSLQDSYGVVYPPAVESTNDWYEETSQSNPWDSPLEPGQTKIAVVFFNVFKGPKKEYFLVGRDFDWTNPDSRKVAAGTF